MEGGVAGQWPGRGRRWHSHDRGLDDASCWCVQMGAGCSKIARGHQFVSLWSILKEFVAVFYFSDFSLPFDVFRDMFLICLESFGWLRVGVEDV